MKNFLHLPIRYGGVWHRSQLSDMAIDTQKVCRAKLWLRFLQFLESHFSHFQQGFSARASHWRFKISKDRNTWSKGRDFYEKTNFRLKVKNLCLKAKSSCYIDSNCMENLCRRDFQTRGKLSKFSENWNSSIMSHQWWVIMFRVCLFQQMISYQNSIGKCIVPRLICDPGGLRFKLKPRKCGLQSKRKLPIRDTRSQSSLKRGKIVFLLTTWLAETQDWWLNLPDITYI